MNGAESLVKTFLANGVDICFANPGTSEMNFVAALDQHLEMRCVLCLFEGVASGAADGYHRMSGAVAATMFHLAPGFGNGYANLHNARKAGVGVINVMGDHASYHLAYDSPLKGDAEGVSRAVSHWTRTSLCAETVAEDGRAAIAAARAGNGQIATLILPADAAWGDVEGQLPEALSPPVPLNAPSSVRCAAAAQALGQPGAALFLGGAASHGALFEQAGQIAAATGCRLIAPQFVSRLERGAGTPICEQLPYRGDEAAEILADVSTLVCIGTVPPVNFFAYPGKPSRPTAAGCTVIELCRPDQDAAATMAGLFAAVGADGAEVSRRAHTIPDRPAEGALTGDAACALMGRWLPEDAIICNESITGGITLAEHTEGAARHDLLITMGGAIGSALPMAIGAAFARPERHVMAVIGDGSAMYTIQALWTMAREELDITIVIFANRTYRILHVELAAMGIDKPGRNAQRMFDLTDPALDWCALAEGHGVAAIRASTTAEFEAALDQARATPGPCLIEAVI